MWITYKNARVAALRVRISVGQRDVEWNILFYNTYTYSTFCDQSLSTPGLCHLNVKPQYTVHNTLCAKFACGDGSDKFFIGFNADP